MPTVYSVCSADGVPLDARFHLDQGHIVFHSRGGAKGAGALNADYTAALRLLLERLAVAGEKVTGAWVDSALVQSLPLEQRAVFMPGDQDLPPDQQIAAFASRMKGVRSDPGAVTKGGNSTKRLRIATSFKGGAEAFAQLLGGVDGGGDHRSLERLPVEVLNRATPEFIWRAVQRLKGGFADHPFGPSTDYDLIADDGTKLPPKAVFGVALSEALGGVPVEPKHFTAGETSACFRLLAAAGFQVVKRGEAPTDATGDTEADSDPVWTEGKVRLVSHLKRERGSGLAMAKKAKFRREHGKLFCERCGEDPVQRHGTVHGEACIEVHHASKHISEMDEGHETTLDDLQCLCANCHRLVHRLLRVEGQAV